MDLSPWRRRRCRDDAISRLIQYARGEAADFVESDRAGIAHRARRQLGHFVGRGLVHARQVGMILLNVKQVGAEPSGGTWLDASLRRGVGGCRGSEFGDLCYLAALRSYFV